jgi:hypothetical protein
MLAPPDCQQLSGPLPQPGQPVVSTRHRADPASIGRVPLCIFGGKPSTTGRQALVLVRLTAVIRPYHKVALLLRLFRPK